jgi:hypothetical protein
MGTDSALKSGQPDTALPEDKTSTYRRGQDGEPAVPPESGHVAARGGRTSQSPGDPEQPRPDSEQRSQRDGAPRPEGGLRDGAPQGDQRDGAPRPEGGQRDGARRPARLARIAAADKASATLVERLLDVGLTSLASAYRDGDFAFRLDGTAGPGGIWQLIPSGASLRYAAIAALGLARLSEAAQRCVLGGATCQDLVGRLAARLGAITSPGDAALVCWAAAETRHKGLPQALARLAELDQPAQPAYVVDAAWVLSALVAARPQHDVEAELRHARRRLIGARGAVLYPHVDGRDPAPHRAHVGSFADQIYPVQALARLHRSSPDPEALAIADGVAAAVCAAQGPAGQWWWHYDSRTGGVVEGYPVYSVHQHAMAPMALFDLAEAGGDAHFGAVCRGLRWLARPPETAEPLLLDAPPVTWRKVARRDPRKLVRGLRASCTGVRPGLRLALLDHVFPPGAVDHETRPYEAGWLLFAWQS